MCQRSSPTQALTLNPSPTQALRGEEDDSALVSLRSRRGPLRRHTSAPSDLLRSRAAQASA